MDNVFLKKKILKTLMRLCKKLYKATRQNIVMKDLVLLLTIISLISSQCDAFVGI